MSEAWKIRHEDEVGGKPLTVGCSFAIEGEKGKRYNYIRTVTNEFGEEWIDCFGGNSGNQKARSVHRDAIKANSIKAKRISPPVIRQPAAKARKGRR